MNISIIFSLDLVLQEEEDEQRRSKGQEQGRRVVDDDLQNGSNGASSNGTGDEEMPATLYSPLSPYRVRIDLPEVLSKELRDM